jgi:hypothetical protein
MKEHQQISRRTLLSALSAVGIGLPAARVLAGEPVRASQFDPKFELLISYTIATQQGFRTHRPYVAVWLEDKDGKSVRTLNLYVQTGRRGPRWIPDLRRWFRREEDRKKVAGGDLVATVSAPTRDAGKYSVAWDGKNDKGELVAQGDFTVCIEAAREHGTYQLITQPVKIGTKAFKQVLTGNVEISEAQIEFRKRAKA